METRRDSEYDSVAHLPEDPLIRPHALPCLALTLALALAASCSHGAHAEESVLRFTAIPSEQSTDLALKFQPIADHLARMLFNGYLFLRGSWAHRTGMSVRSEA